MKFGANHQRPSDEPEPYYSRISESPRFPTAPDAVVVIGAPMVISVKDYDSPAFQAKFPDDASVPKCKKYLRRAIESMLVEGTESDGIWRDTVRKECGITVEPAEKAEYQYWIRSSSPRPR